MQRVCYLFPGQGAQYVGMGKDLYDNYPEARAIFEEAEKILPDIGIKRLCFEGPIEELTQTLNSQVCILVMSIAAFQVLDSRIRPKKSFQPICCAGLSLGELTALVCAGSLSFKDGVRLVRRRGELMEEASLKNPGIMASIIGLSIQELRPICDESGAEIANLNCPGQIVISGKRDCVEKAISISLERGAKRAIPLNVSGAFHSSLMKEIAESFRLELERISFLKPMIKVVSNVTGDYEDASEIKDNLVKQLYSSVLWEDSIKRISGDGIDTFFEIGPGRVLKGLLRRIDENLKVFNIDTIKDIESLL